MSKIVLVTGATGKAGSVFIKRLLADSKFDSFTIRVLCHHREPEPHERIQNIHGSIEHRDVVKKAMEDVTHVLHLATVKETPDQIMDVAVKGLFWLLETCRSSQKTTPKTTPPAKVIRACHHTVSASKMERTVPAIMPRSVPA